ncbi:ArgE/DapE family deacylase [Candidatus Bathyarchaeota archaeon]|nr:ArgE/DapE family deacylase [Candidatus Bathyarchaeota archaeon]
MASSKQILYSKVNENGELTELLQHLLRIPSDNPPGDTAAITGFIHQYLAEHGIDSRIIVTKPGIANIVATVGEGDPHLILNGHLDTFPAEVGEPWTIPPYSGELREGKVYGRGAGDMKGGLAALLYSFVKIAKNGHKGKLTFTGTSDEETGGEWGALWLLKNEPSVMGDAVLNGEPSGLTVRIGEKSRVSIVLEAEGKAAHGSFAGYVGENAIMKMVRILPLVAMFQGTPARLTEETLRLTEEVMKGYRQQYGHESVTMANVLKEVTVNIGTIQGGSEDNIVPAYCKVKVDTRLPLGISPAEITEMIREKIHSVDPSIKVSWARPPQIVTESTYSSIEAEITKKLAENSEEVTGVKPLYSFTSGGTDCRFWRKLGVPAVSYGPRVYAMGGVDEHITVEDLITTAKVHIGTIMDYLSGGNP